MITSLNKLDELMESYPILRESKSDILRAFEEIISSYEKKGKLLVAGNGGSAADSGHIVGELMKGFLSRRRLDDSLREKLIKTDDEMGSFLADNLQGALAAIDLTAQGPLITALINDIDGEIIFAQQILGYGRSGDIFLAISSSGNAKNILYALHTAKAMGILTIILTGSDGGRAKEIADISIRVPAEDTFKIQELHLPVYHTLCAMVEAYFFDNNSR